jgi:pimeloyl-ACP methyl ester carboxylesterase
LSARPTTRYAKSGDVNIAYQVVGDGPFDLVFVPAAISHVDLIGDDPERAGFFSRLASFSRLIVLDKRGTGASDPAPVGDLETRIDDVRAVLDAVGSPRAAVMGVSEGGPMSLGFAASHPSRVAAVVVYASLPRFAWAPDVPWAQRLDDWNRELDREVAIRCAAAITDDMRGLDLSVRVGIHTGECTIADGKVAGIAVSIGARVAASAEANEVLVSQTVRDLVAGSGISFVDRGSHELKGVPGEWRLYALEH